MTQLALGIDPEPLGVAPFIMAARGYAGAARHRPRRAGAPARAGHGASRRWARTSAATSWPACSPPAWTRDRRLRLFIDVGTNCEIALGGAERMLATAAPAGPAFEAAQIRCGMRAADGAIEVVRDRRRRARAGRDRRGRARRALRLGPRRRGRRAGPRRPARPLGAASPPTRRRPSCRPRLADAPRRAGERRARVRAALAARRATPSGPCSSRSATCASCSSRRPRSRRAGRCCCEELGVECRATSSRCCSPARFGTLPLARQRRPHRPRARAARDAHRLGAATSPARAPRWCCSRRRSAHAAEALLEEVEYVELSDRTRLQRPLHRPAQAAG